MMITFMLPGTRHYLCLSFLRTESIAPARQHLFRQSGRSGCLIGSDLGRNLLGCLPKQLADGR